MSHGWIVIWRLPAGITPARRTQFHTAFYGQQTSSHKGRYEYRRAGLLDEVPHRKLGRGVILVRDEDREPVEALLRAHAEELYVRRVRLEPEDVEALSVPATN